MPCTCRPGLTCLNCAVMGRRSGRALEAPAVAIYTAAGVPSAIGKALASLAAALKAELGGEEADAAMLQVQGVLADAMRDGDDDLGPADGPPAPESQAAKAYSVDLETESLGAIARRLRDGVRKLHSMRPQAPKVLAASAGRPAMRAPAPEEPPEVLAYSVRGVEVLEEARAVWQTWERTGSGRPLGQFLAANVDPVGFAAGAPPPPARGTIKHLDQRMARLEAPALPEVPGEVAAYAARGAEDYTTALECWGTWRRTNNPRPLGLYLEANLGGLPSTSNQEN